MKTQSVSVLDAPWLMIESETNLMHVAGLVLFELPPDVPRDFVHTIVDQMRRTPQASSPFDRRLKRTGAGRAWPQWELLDEVDLEYHLRHAALPYPGSERELAIAISRLHSIPLDKSRPLWECHLIEGLEGNRFAMYFKSHHALIDGVGAIRIIRQALSEDPDERGMPPVWAYRTRPRPDQTPPPEPPSELTEARRKVTRSAPVMAMRSLGNATAAGARLARGAATKPYSAPRSILNTPITAHRRFATQSYELARFKALAERSGGTVNDVVLAVCAGGLRSYLSEIGALPDESLVASLPVSVRPKDSPEGSGNAITFAMALLGTDIADQRERMAAIQKSTREAKQHLARLPRQAMNQYTLMLMAPQTLSLMSGVGLRKPMFNVTISNVPGPPRPLFLNGARVLEVHPVSLVFGGQALNITVLSYADLLDFAFIACGSSLPHVQRLSIHCGEALAEMEKEYA